MDPDKIYHYCTCGLSKKDPFCDGSHKGTKFKSLKFKLKDKQTIAQLCGCKKNCPEAGAFCDGSHSNFGW
jgi:CDGSH-type Zn-finger protein